MDGKKEREVAARKSNKPLIEKRRRARINECLQQLKEIIVQERQLDSARGGRLEKADILEMTVDYIKRFSQEGSPSFLQTAYELGVERCVQEISQFMTSQHDFVDVSIRHGLVSHCKKMLRSHEKLEHPKDHAADSNRAIKSKLQIAADSSTSPKRQRFDKEDDSSLPTTEDNESSKGGASELILEKPQSETVSSTKSSWIPTEPSSNEVPLSFSTALGCQRSSPDLCNSTTGYQPDTDSFHFTDLGMSERASIAADACSEEPSAGLPERHVAANQFCNMTSPDTSNQHQDLPLPHSSRSHVVSTTSVPHTSRSHVISTTSVPHTPTSHVAHNHTSHAGTTPSVPYTPTSPEITTPSVPHTPTSPDVPTTTLPQTPTSNIGKSTMFTCPGHFLILVDRNTVLSQPLPQNLVLGPTFPVVQNTFTLIPTPILFKPLNSTTTTVNIEQPETITTGSCGPSLFWQPRLSDQQSRGNTLNIASPGSFPVFHGPGTLLKLEQENSSLIPLEQEISRLIPLAQESDSPFLQPHVQIDQNVSDQTSSNAQDIPNTSTSNIPDIHIQVSPNVLEIPSQRSKNVLYIPNHISQNIPDTPNQKSPIVLDVSRMSLTAPYITDQQSLNKQNPNNDAPRKDQNDLVESATHNMTASSKASTPARATQLSVTTNHASSTQFEQATNTKNSEPNSTQSSNHDKPLHTASKMTSADRTCLNLTLTNNSCTKSTSDDYQDTNAHCPNGHTTASQMSLCQQAPSLRCVQKSSLTVADHTGQMSSVTDHNYNLENIVNGFLLRPDFQPCDQESSNDSLDDRTNRIRVTSTKSQSEVDTSREGLRLLASPTSGDEPVFACLQEYGRALDLSRRDCPTNRSQGTASELDLNNNHLLISSGEQSIRGRRLGHPCKGRSVYDRASDQVFSDVSLNLITKNGPPSRGGDYHRVSGLSSDIFVGTNNVGVWRPWRDNHS